MERTMKKDFLRLVVDRNEDSLRIRGLYLITDHGERLTERVQSAIDGGVAVVQFRSKLHPAAEVVPLGEELKIGRAHV